ncbi:MAG: hypothetical protein ABI134_01780 [Byssovorax sp.]
MSDLDEELVRYRTLAFLVHRAKERALGAPFDKYVSDLGIPALRKKNVDRKGALEEHFDTVEQTLFEQYLLRLMAVFERLAFERLSAAVGAARTAVEDNYPDRSPFARAAKHLVKNLADDLTTLADIEKLLASYPQAASKDLQELREHRNWIAHGGRVGRQSRFSRIEDVHKSLTELLDIIQTQDG